MSGNNKSKSHSKPIFLEPSEPSKRFLAGLENARKTGTLAQFLMPTMVPPPPAKTSHPASPKKESPKKGGKPKAKQPKSKSHAKK